MKIVRFSILAVVFVLLNSCVYHFAGKYASLPGGIRTVYIDSIENLTYEPNLQIKLKRYLLDELNLDTRVKLTNKNDAQGLIEVKITKYNISPSAFDKSGFASMYRCFVVATVSLKNSKGYVIKNKSVSSYKDYSSNDLISATEIARNRVSNYVLKDLASKIKDELFVGF